MSRMLRRFTLTVGLAAFFWAGPLVSGFISSDASSLKWSDLREGQEDLVVETRQLLAEVKEESRLAALRHRNRLLNLVYTLEGKFDPAVFTRVRQEAEWICLGLGGDPDTLAELFDLSMKMVRLADPGPTLRESYGLSHKSESDKDVAKAEFRRELGENISIVYLYRLLDEDPESSLGSFRAYTGALRNLQAGEQMRAQAAQMELAADQQLVQDLATGIPLMGDAVDIIGIATGEAAFTGEQLSAVQRTLDAVLLLAPDALEAWFSGKPVFVRDAGKLAETMRRMEAPALARLAQTLGRTPDQVKAFTRKMGDAWQARKQARLAKRLEAAEAARAAEAKALSDRLDREVAELLEEAGQAPEFRQEIRVWEAAEQEGREKISRMAETFESTGSPGLPGGDLIRADLLDAYQELRMDKRALNRLQAEEFQSLREQVQDIENQLFTHVDENGRMVVGQVDRDAIQELNQAMAGTGAGSLTSGAVERARKRIAGDVRAHGAKHGAGPGSGYSDQVLDFENLNISVFNATNKPPAKGKVGFDRDITFQVEIPGRTVVVRDPGTNRVGVVRVPPKKVDVPAELVEESYHPSLYARLNPGRPLPPPDKIKAFSRAMDHQVTDALHKDAYRLNLEDVTDFFRDPTLLAAQGSRIEGFSDTVTYKSRHWFDAAGEAGEPGAAMACIAEGMRQASKQKDNYMALLSRHYGLSRNMDPGLQKGLHIFDMVRDGRLSVPEAEAALRSISTTKEEVVDKFGQYFESMVKLAARSSGGGR